MVLSQEAQRAWKLLSYIACTGAGFQLLFREEYRTYDNGEHVFTGIQSWYNKKVDEVLLGKDFVDQVKNADKQKTSSSSEK